MKGCVILWTRRVKILADVICERFPVEDGLCGLGVVHAVDSGSRGEHALSRHLRAAREVEHLVDAVQVGGVDVEQGPFPGRK